MPGQFHHVDRRTLEIRAPTQTEAHAWRQRARPLWQHHLAPALERAFDHACGDQEILRARRLEIEIHVSHEDDDPAVERAFADALHNRLQSLEGDLTAPDALAVQGSPLQRISVLEREHEWMETFLITGVLPRWGGGTTRAEIEERFLRYVDTLAPDRFREILLRSPNAARRLSLQLSGYTQARALEKLLPASEVTGWAAQRNDSVPDQYPHTATVSGHQVGMSGLSVWTAARWESMWRLWAATGSLRTEHPNPTSGANEPNAVSTSLALPSIEARQVVEFQQSESSSFSARAAPSAPDAVPLDRQDTVPAGSRGDRPSHAASVDQPDPLPSLDGSALPVANAGIVLLAPFFPALFSALGVIPPPESGSRGSLARAVLLLHYLSTGETAAPEPLLAIPKLLCGLALEEPVPFRASFEPAELAEADSMVQAAIAHWTALGNTSIVGLQTAFLQRPGLLRDNGSTWQLRVEHRPWDVLLERVPWGFRTICLPWMPKALAADWPAYA